MLRDTHRTNSSIMNSPANGIRLADEPAIAEEAAGEIRRFGSMLELHLSKGGMCATASGVAAWRRMYLAQDVRMSSGGADGQSRLGDSAQVLACSEFHSIVSRRANRLRLGKSRRLDILARLCLRPTRHVLAPSKASIVISIASGEANRFRSEMRTKPKLGTTVKLVGPQGF